MGLFDSIFMAKDLISEGIAAFKASERLEELVGQSVDYYDSVLSDENRELHATYTKLKEKQDAIEDLDERNAMTEDVEKAMVAYLVSVCANASVSKKFRDDVQAAITEWQRTNDAPEELFEKYMMKQAKTDEERAEFKRILEEVKAEEEK